MNLSKRCLGWPGLGLLLFVVGATARADEPPPPGEAPPRAAEGHAPKIDKSGYTLFNPVPHEALRELQTDRPDQTEGPYTVDAGHVQIESDLFNYYYDRTMPGPHRVTHQAVDVADFNARVGLLNNLETDFIVLPYSWARDEDCTTGQTTEREGFGDTTIRVKWNIFGNDAEDTPNLGFGLMPYVKIPTNTGHLANHYVEGGLLVPINLNLPDTWEIGAMTEVDALHQQSESGYAAQWVNSLVVARDIIHERLSGYLEFYSAVGGGEHLGPYETVDGGLLLAITKDMQLDIGINVGVTRRAPDYNPFLGLSVRF